MINKFYGNSNKKIIRIRLKEACKAIWDLNNSGMIDKLTPKLLIKNLKILKIRELIYKSGRLEKKMKSWKKLNNSIKM